VNECVLEGGGGNAVGGNEYAIHVGGEGDLDAGGDVGGSGRVEAVIGAFWEFL
jgi:hypothetical protein